MMLQRLWQRLKRTKMDGDGMQRKLDYKLLANLSEKYGPAFYLLESDTFKKNFNMLLQSFKRYYSYVNIAYSYKTNYIPKLVKIVNNFGGYAEVVSDMELDIALKSGVLAENIIWNGPVKNYARMKELLLTGGTINVDSVNEMEIISGIAGAFPEKVFNVGVRCNYDIGDGVCSRFGIDVNGEDFDRVLTCIKKTKNIKLCTLQAHFAKRNVDYWFARTTGLLKVYDKVKCQYGLIPDRLDFGGGIFGLMPVSLRTQLGIKETSFDDYALNAAKLVANHFKNSEKRPELIIEPGSAIAGNSMRFVSRIVTIKKIRDKYIATAIGSQKNISMNGLNPPMEIFSCGNNAEIFEDIDIAGYTCIEGDVLYRNYCGTLAEGDFIIISNCGSYSLVMKPPFILPNFPVIEICEENVEVVKRAESFDDLFHTFEF